MNFLLGSVTAEAAGLDTIVAAGGEGLAGAARTRLLETPVPTAVEQAVREAYGRLVEETAVAVRSSATAEDLHFASFAGQQGTYLNVIGPQAVLDAVRRCWASLWTDRAVAYRESNGIDHARVRLAVVVQLMVDTDGGAILQRHQGDKRLAIRSLPGVDTAHGNTEHGGDGCGGLCLDDAQVRELAALGARAEEHYGAPQDTEWAIDADGKLWLTQSRPITTVH